MGFTIALAGKGGTGKTTVAALIIKYLKRHGKTPILAVDADSNACLNEALGLEVHTTIGRIREQSLDSIRSSNERLGGMSIEQLFEYQVQQSIVESDGLDLIVMGRPEGPGCYCAANNIIRKYTDLLSQKYPYIVIDNEAGMEHLSRRTNTDVDILMLVSDATIKGIMTMNRINDLIKELNLKVKRVFPIVNMADSNQFDLLSQKAKEYGFNDIRFIPKDNIISEYDIKGRPIIQIPEDSVSYLAVKNILDCADLPSS
ncbi:MAG: AAA family ATPase [Thermodesulfovibrionales bacterium]|nr:AAA family ATPase [Thermodesulfovibrionales bacterium]